MLAPKLRLISLNTNYCPRENFWLIINSTDPLGQLAWLADVLQLSENRGEKVHIIGHIHPVNCLLSWSTNYYKIVNRYESIIMAQIFGHSHKDEFHLFYDLNNNTRATNVAYLGPSVTTASFLNPGYRVYVADGIYDNSSYQIIDYKTVILNLTEANLHNSLEWKLEYWARDAFNLSSLSPQNWADLVERMLANVSDPLVDKIYNFYSKSSDSFPDCNSNCRRTLLCSFKQSRSDNFMHC